MKILISPGCNRRNLNRKVSIFENYIAVLENINYSIPTKFLEKFHRINISLNKVFQAWLFSLRNHINASSVLISEYIKINNSTFKKNNIIPKHLNM